MAHAGVCKGVMRRTAEVVKAEIAVSLALSAQNQQIQPGLLRVVDHHGHQLLHVALAAGIGMHRHRAHHARAQRAVAQAQLLKTVGHHGADPAAAHRDEVPRDLRRAVGIHLGQQRLEIVGAMSLRKDKVRKIHHVVPFRGQRKAIFHRQIRIHRMIPPGYDSEMFLLIITYHGFARKARAQNRSWQR